MVKQILKSITCALLLCLLTPSTLTARPYKKEKGNYIVHQLQELGIDEKQKYDIRKILKDSRENIEATQEDYWKSQDELYNILMKGPNDTEALKEAVDRMSEAKLKLVLLRAANMEQIRNLLTEDQTFKLQLMDFSLHKSKLPKSTEDNSKTSRSENSEKPETLSTPTTPTE